MTEIELVWLAGLLEGEGSFMKPSPSDPNRPTLSVEMTDEDIIIKAANLLNTKYCRSDRWVSKGWKSCFRITLRGASAVQAMKLLQRWMGPRRQSQIATAIENYKSTNRKSRQIRIS